MVCLDAARISFVSGGAPGLVSDSFPFCFLIDRNFFWGLWFELSPYVLITVVLCAKACFYVLFNVAANTREANATCR